MSKSTERLIKNAAILRDEFDRGFAEVPSSEVPRREHLLAVRMGGDAYAIRLAEIAGLHAGQRIVPFPTPMRHLLGVASFRGQLTPVYDLTAILGYPSGPGKRWLVLIRRPYAVALAFDTFEAQLVIRPEEIVSPTGAAGDAPRPHLRGAVPSEHAIRPIVDLPSVVDAIQKQVESIRDAAQVQKER